MPESIMQEEVSLAKELRRIRPGITSEYRAKYTQADTIKITGENVEDLDEWLNWPYDTDREPFKVGIKKVFNRYPVDELTLACRLQNNVHLTKKMEYELMRQNGIESLLYDPFDPAKVYFVFKDRKSFESVKKQDIMKVGFSWLKKFYVPGIENKQFNRDWVDYILCEYCAKFRHKENHCPRKRAGLKPICMYCSDEHLGKFCLDILNEAAHKCANCIEAFPFSKRQFYNHKVNHKSCAIFQRELERLRKANASFNEPIRAINKEGKMSSIISQNEELKQILESNLDPDLMEKLKNMSFRN